MKKIIKFFKKGCVITVIAVLLAFGGEITVTDSFSDESSVSSWEIASFDGHLSLQEEYMRVEIKSIITDTAMGIIKNISLEDASKVTSVSFDIMVPDRDIEKPLFRLICWTTGKWEKFFHDFSAPKLTKNKWQSFTYKITSGPGGPAEKIRIYFNDTKVFSEVPVFFVDNFKVTIDDGVRTVHPTTAVKPPRTMVFPRSQLKYSLFQNYYHVWIDRPLFHDRGLRYPTGSWEYMNKESWRRDVESVKSYGVDGLANLAFPSTGQLDLYLQASALCKELNTEGFILYPEFGGVGNVSEAFFNTAVKCIKAAAESPYSWKLKGRPVITSYVGDASGPRQLGEFLTKLREKTAVDFLYITDMRLDINNLIKEFDTAGNISEQSKNAFKNKLAGYLDVSDGVMFAGANHMADTKVHRYDHAVHIDFYTKGFISLFKEVLSREEYQNKLLGLSAAVGYINHMSGSSQGEDGTLHLRSTMEAALGAKPDFILLPEWNEVNENTHLQPTVANGLTSQRIMKYYMHTLKKEKFTGNPGDDESIPNLVFSYRNVVETGEVIDLELLNIPTGGSLAYEAIVEIVDHKGAVVFQSKPQKMSAKILMEKRIQIPSETLAVHSALFPRVTIITKEKRVSFDQTAALRIAPGLCVNYKWIKHAVRDLLLPKRADVSLYAGKTAGTYRINADLEFDEPLASAEILENETEIYAYDRLNEFDREKNYVILARLTAYGTQYAKGIITARGASGLVFRPLEIANSDIRDFSQNGLTVTLNQRCNINWRGMLLVIPKTDAEKAFLDFSLSDGDFSVPVKALIKYKRYAHSYPKRMSWIFELLDKQPDIPVQIQNNKVSFVYEFSPGIHNPLYTLRAVSVSGKTYRKYIGMPEKKQNPQVQIIPVKSQSTHNVVPCTVDTLDLPDISYIFTPEAGHILPAVWPEYSGELGAGLRYSEPYFDPSVPYPAHSVRAAPEWKKDGDAYTLYFDGVGTYLCLPGNVFPKGAFTLDFEIKPEGKGKQVLFRHCGMLVCSLELINDNGKLSAFYTDHAGVTHPFDTGLKIPENVWTKITVRYNLKELSFTVNGVHKTYPFDKSPLYFGDCLIGAPGRLGFGVSKEDGFFKGGLRSLRISRIP